MSRRWRIRWAGAAVVALGASAALAGSATALVPPLPDPDIVDGPSDVRVTLSVSAGSVQAREGRVEAVDADPSDGTVAVLVSEPVRILPGRLARAGVRVRSRITRRGSLVELTGARGRFAFVSFRGTVRGAKLEIRLWKSDPAFPGATRREDRCLRITAVAGTTGRVSARGLELVPLFEHALVLQLRDAAGRSVGLRAITAREGRFRPDFSGYLTPGTWSGTVPHRVARRQRGVLQVWVTSARDGALDCLVQVPVTLAPRR